MLRREQSRLPGKRKETMLNRNMRNTAILLVVFLAVYMFGNYFAEKNLMSGSGSSSYSYERLESDIAKNKVKSIEVVQNAQVPTGSAIVKLNDGEKKVAHVTDVNKVIDLAQQYKVSCQVDDVKSSDAGWLSMILPWIVIGVIMMFMFGMMSRASGGGGGNKMMNFGKSRAKMQDPESQNIRFDQVAGLQEEKEELKVLKNEKSVTKDGHEVELAGNIGGFKDVEGVLTNGGEGVGLFRTEFLYMDSDHFPTEDEQFEAYKQVLEGMQGKKVVVRTLDIGGDKHLSYYEFPQEMNPFLGYRAIRLCLKETDIFKTQLRALCRASVYGRLCIMFPMIATVKEFRDAKAIFEEVKAELVAEGVAVSGSIEVGMMVEIPAAAVLADQFAKYADFFSIGTNDLIQYSMAADRMSEHVSYLYQPYNPSVLRLVANTIKGAHEHGKWVGMCGAMAGEPHAVPILLGLGLDEFSMSATQILKARKVVKSLSYEEMQGLAQECLNKDTADEVLETVKTKLGE